MGMMFEDLKAGLEDVDAYLGGKRVNCKVIVPDEIDVKHIRKNLGMTQANFSNTFGLSLDTIKHWESGRRTPEAPARVLLTIISRDPKAVMRALGRKGTDAKPRRNGKALHAGTSVRNTSLTTPRAGN